MLAFVIVLQVLVALFLIMVVLLQPGNRGGSAAALGGAGSDTVFGARGANTFLSKLTFGAAACFMITSMALSFLSTPHADKSVLDALEKTPPPSAPADAPAAEQAQPEANTPPADQAQPDAAAPSDTKEPENN